MLIVEGPDGAGKSTLISTLSTNLGWPVAPRVVDKQTKAMVDLKKWTEENLTLGFQEMIFDRHRLISEPIYGSLMRREAEPGFSDFQWLYRMQRKFLFEIDPIIIWCLPPLSVVRDNVNRGSDNDAVRQYIRPIYWLYHNRASLEPDPLIYDYTQDDLVELVEVVNEELETRDEQ